MIIEVRGTNTRNKGAELMLRSVIAQMGTRDKIAVDPSSGTFQERASLGLLTRLGGSGVDRLVDTVARVAPGRFDHRLREAYGVVRLNGVDAVLDASGFAYSDQFEVERCAAAADAAQRAAAKGMPYILLPQAFGPFTSPDLRAQFSRLLQHSSLVFARERASLEHVMSSGARTDHVRLAPDFTCLLEGKAPDVDFDGEGLALVVPSAKLLTATDASSRDAYLPLMAHAVQQLRTSGLDVRLVLHERDDETVLEGVQDLLPVRAPVIADEDPLILKGVIGQARVVVGSRFHALVSALSQGVPALGIGWSHKYQMLFEDYGCGEKVIPATSSVEDLQHHISDLLAPASRAARVGELRGAAEQERERARGMWREVDAALGRSALQA